MALTDENTMVMPVSPMYGNGGNGFGGNDGWAWIILLLLIAGNGWGGFGGLGGFGGMGGFAADGAMLYPWMNQAEITTGGFQNAATNSAISSLQNSVTSGFGDVQNALCGGFAGVNATVNGAQNALAQQMYTNQIADLERSFANQTAVTQGMNTIAMNQQNCCCENRAAVADLKYTVATEACADRAAVSDALRDVLEANTASTQRILDQMCQDKIDAKNEKIVELQNQLNMATLRESQTAQNAFISQGLTNEVDALYNRLSNCPVPTVPVYGRQPIFNCNNNGCGFGSF